MTFDTWYEKHWDFRNDSSNTADRKRAYIAWLAAKDFNPTNLMDLEYICEIAMQHFGNTSEDGWRGRAHYYRDRLRELFGEMPG